MFQHGKGRAWRGRVKAKLPARTPTLVVVCSSSFVTQVCAAGPEKLGLDLLVGDEHVWQNRYLRTEISGQMLQPSY